MDRRQGYSSLLILRYRYMGRRRRLLEVWISSLDDIGSIPDSFTGGIISPTILSRKYSGECP